MANPFVHVELATNDVAKAKAFYGELFNWKLEDVPDGSYTMINVGWGTGGGMMKNPMPGAPSAWLAYVQVESVAAATKKAPRRGGTQSEVRTRSVQKGSCTKPPSLAQVRVPGER